MAESNVDDLARQLEETEQRATAAEAQLAAAKQAAAQSAAVLGQIQNGKPPSKVRMILANPTVWIVTLLGVAILGILWWFLKQGTVLQGLEEPAFARGLITFIFSIGALGIGIILTIAALVPGEESGKAFTRGKEVFTILVGILGTIIGFYFGTGATDTADDLEIAAIVASSNKPAAGTEVSLSSAISGGTAPYKTFWAFDSNQINPVTKSDLSEGAIQFDFQAPVVDENTEINVQLVVSDAKLNSSARTAKIFVSPK